MKRKMTPDSKTPSLNPSLALNCVKGNLKCRNIKLKTEKTTKNKIKSIYFKFVVYNKLIN